jgi:multiple sugar transport system permease protein
MTFKEDPIVPEASVALKPRPAQRGSLAALASRWLHSRAAFSLTLLAPTLALISFVIVLPMLRALAMSFQQYELAKPDSLEQFVGLAHYIALLKSPLYYEAWSNTLIYSGGTVFGGFSIGFAIALALNQSFRGRNLFRGLFLLPWVIPPISGALIWWWIFSAAQGILNYYLEQVGLISQPVAWISDPGIALYAVIIAGIWRIFPFHMVMLLAALQTIPGELNDAASIDGANAFQHLRYVTLPSIRNIIVTVLTLSFIWAFQEFTMIWGITKGGPGFSTRTLLLFIYQTGFTFFRMGEAAAAGTIVLGILLIVAALALRFGVSRDVQ